MHAGDLQLDGGTREEASRAGPLTVDRCVNSFAAPGGLPFDLFDPFDLFASSWKTPPLKLVCGRVVDPVGRQPADDVVMARDGHEPAPPRAGGRAPDCPRN